MRAERAAASGCDSPPTFQPHAGGHEEALLVCGRLTLHIRRQLFDTFTSLHQLLRKVKAKPELKADHVERTISQDPVETGIDQQIHTLLDARS